MSKYRYATDAFFMSEKPFVYNNKECMGVSCYIEFQVINRDLKEVLFELEDNLDPYEHEDKVPLLIQRIQSFGFAWDIENEEHTNQLSFRIDLIGYMEKVNYDHKIDTLITFPCKYYLDTIGEPDEEEKEMFNKLGLSTDILEPEEISKEDFYALLRNKNIFSGVDNLLTESNASYQWIEVKE